VPFGGLLEDVLVPRASSRRTAQARSELENSSRCCSDTTTVPAAKTHIDGAIADSSAQAARPAYSLLHTAQARNEFIGRRARQRVSA